MEWCKLQYSRKQITKAGKCLSGIENDSMCIDDAMMILNNWRSFHRFPLNTIQMALRRVANKYSKNSIISQRLKRTPSIIVKLKINPEMELARMQDIGGCRVVLNNMSELQNVTKFLNANSEMNHELKNQISYIEKPKKSGYRCHHIIYKYQSTNPEYIHYNDCLIEMQIRTKIQHSWATAVETMGTFLGEALKSSIGSDDWLKFFRLAGSAFAIIEKTPIDLELGTEKDIKIGIKDLNKKLKAFEVMDYYNHALKVIQDKKIVGKYFLLTLDKLNHRLTIKGYSDKLFEKAAEDYMKYEKEEKENASLDAVLVSVDSIQALRKAYPNYFIDTRSFVNNLKEAIK